MLVTFARYRTVTLDTTSAEVAVTAALVEAQGLLEDELDRWLESQPRSETVVMARDGRVYPKAYPVTTGPAGATVDPDGRSWIGTSPDQTPAGFFTSYSPQFPPTATVTYTGGYTAITVPDTLAREIAWRAWEILHPGEFGGGVPAGAVAVAVGDASVSFGSGGAPSTGNRPAAARVRGYRRRRV